METETVPNPNKSGSTVTHRRCLEDGHEYRQLECRDLVLYCQRCGNLKTIKTYAPGDARGPTCQ